MSRKIFSPEFKAESASKVLDDGMSISAACQTFGVGDTAMNGQKLLVSSAVSLIAIALFIHDGVIAWYEGTLVLLGTLAGGYVAAHLSRRLPQSYVRSAVIVVGIVITRYFFYAT